jgi:transcriptional regulator with XRE-family HTH domain
VVPKAPHPILKRLGNRVRELRKAKGWSQEEFADICRIDRSYMSGIERGIRNTSVLNVAKLCRALGISLSDIFKH